MPLDHAASRRLGLLLACTALTLTACGGGGPDAGSPGEPSPPPPNNAARIAAATATAQSAGNACAAIRPFYWEIGDQSATLASGSVSRPGGAVVRADDVMSIASASKWLYSSYFVRTRFRWEIEPLLLVFAVAGWFEIARRLGSGRGREAPS